MDDIPVIQLLGKKTTKDIDIREAFELEDIKHRITKYYFLNFTKKYNAPVNSNFKFQIDGKEIDISETDDFQLIKPEYIPEIKLGSGVCLDISIQRREIEYDVEENDADVKAAKDKYLMVHNKLMNYIKLKNKEKTDKYVVDPNEKDDKTAFFEETEEYKKTLSDLKADRKDKYDKFIKELERALKEKEVLAE